MRAADFKNDSADTSPFEGVSTTEFNNDSSDTSPSEGVSSNASPSEGVPQPTPTIALPMDQHETDTQCFDED